MTYVVIFDLDGTLVDTPTAIVESFTAALDSIGAEPLSPAAIRATIGLPLEQAFMRLLDAPAGDPRVAHCVAQYQALFREIALPKARSLVFPGVAQGLAELRRHGFTLAIATSKYSPNAESLLDAAGIRDHFRLVVGADQVARPKPDPQTAQLILSAFAVEPRRAVVVGDTSFDLLMARAAGIASIAVTYGVQGTDELIAAGPTWIADSFSGVLKGIQTAYRAITFHPMEVCHYVRYDGIFH